jgi:restriction system protein
MTHRHASSAKILAIGDYTDDAWKLVVGKPIELIYGESLLAMLREVQASPPLGVHKLARSVARRPHHQPLRLVR